jgi:hypothetical protein
MKISNMQIDNLISEKLPVLIGAKRYYDKHLQIANEFISQSKLSTFYKIVDEVDIRSQGIVGKNKSAAAQKQALRNIPFLMFEVDMSSRN